MRDLNHDWTPIIQAKFTADSNPALSIDASADGGLFFLATGGKVANIHVPLGKRIDVIRPTQKPELP